MLENGTDVTSEYTISVANGKVTATRKNAAGAPKGTLELDVNWTVHTDVPSNTELVNTGSGTIGQRHGTNAKTHDRYLPAND